MDETYITRNEHTAIIEKIEAEDNRQNKRLDALENNVQQIQELTASVREMAVSMKQMTASLEKQGDRLDELEKQPGNRWIKLTDAIIGAIAALIATGLVIAAIHYI